VKAQKSILILEDEVELGNVVRDYLAPLYQEVVYTNSPFEAQSLWKKRSFSLILADIAMPGMPGHKLVKHVRALGRIEPVIFVTANSTREVLLDAVRLGVSDVIEKPFRFEDLVQSIDRAFEIEKRRQDFYRKTHGAIVEGAAAESQKKMIGLLQVAKVKN